ncbi:glycine-rich cell wall structural protein [Salvia miltiorrhiza]|uniref:glycine-rich cell wall structural protein n=1 Tax=Salvia miltiorrhiza TaxID=226208 RepID=UPI0025ACA944|nr:glycine-rich cell wall structural protein [Salvia miltiorrhiza]
MKSTFLLLILSLWLIAAFAARQDPSSKDQAGGFMGPGSGFGIPGIPGYGGGYGGYGGGYGGPTGGRSTHGVVRPTVVCSDKGPCYKKKLTCPAKCFSSYGGSGKGYGYGGGGGGCTIDCKKKCTAFC